MSCKIFSLETADDGSKGGNSQLLFLLWQGGKLDLWFWHIKEESLFLVSWERPGATVIILRETGRMIFCRCFWWPGDNEEDWLETTVEREKDVERRLADEEMEEFGGETLLEENEELKDSERMWGKAVEDAWVLEFGEEDWTGFKGKDKKVDVEVSGWSEELKEHDQFNELVEVDGPVNFLLFGLQSQ